MENELLAPNGKPSNLNATQYKLVRSKAFLNWFGDWINDPANSSKVVDDNGEPLVVYHGSDNKFNVFDIKKAVKGFHGLGFYFSDRDLEYGKYVYNCFLNLKKPFDINADYSLQEIKKILGNSYFEIKNLIQEELDYSYNGKIGGFIFYSFAGNNNLKKQGYDGLIQSEIYVAFIPNQIKLADGTNTTFDSSNNDIRFENGGSVRLAPNGNYSYLSASQYEMVRTPEFKKWFGDWEKAYEIGNYDGISKVIAYNTKGFSGEPLVCSHASYNKFNQFNTPSFFQEGDGSGAYGDSTDEEYTNYDVFLNIKNPLELRGSFLREKFIPLISEIYKNAGISEADIKHRIEFAEEYRDGYGLFKLFEKSSRQGIGYNWNWVFDYCKKNGFDGFVMRDSDQSMQNTITTWVALSPNQIKLADGTNLTFDSENDDIRFEQGGELKAESMLKHPLTIKRLKDLDDDNGFWVKQYHAKTKNYKPNTYYHLNTNSGLNAGVGKGLYLGRDKDALISFYDLEGENKTVDTYVGNPNWLDLMDYADYDRYEQEAIRKYGKKYVSKNSISNIDIKGEMLRKLAVEKGFDGIRYYDPQATGEEFVLFDVKKINKVDSNNKFDVGGKIDFTSTKSMLIKINNDSYRVQYQRGERGDTDKNVWFANVISKNNEEIVGRLCFDDFMGAWIYGFSLKEVENIIWDVYRDNNLYLFIEDDYGNEKEIIHIEFSDKLKYEDDIKFEQGGNVKDLIEETTDKLVKEIIKNNYYVDVSHSKTNFGKSNYIYVSNKVDEYGLLDGDKIKIRISDHDVSNFDRVFNEIHLQPYNKFYNEESYFKNTINQLNYYFNNDKFFDKENSFEDIKAYNVQTFQLWDNDVVTKEYVTKKGNKMFEVTRTYRNPITVFKHKGTQNVYKKIPLKYENGGRTISQTPAPNKDRIYGSNENKKYSSKDVSSAKMIKFDENTLEAIKNKVQTHNEQYPDKKINLSSAKAVVRRGMGAYSSSHRPNISGGKPNSRVAWGLARLNAFTYKIVNGKSKSGKYSQDDDLIEELGFKVANYENGGKMSKDIRCINCGWEWNRKDSELWDMYVCHKCGFDNTTFYTSIPINNYSKGGKVESKNPNYLKMFLDL